MSIRSRLIIIILSLVTIPLLFVSTVTFSNYKNSLTESRLTQLQSLAHFKAKEIQAYFESLKNTLEMSRGFYNVRKNIPELSRLQRDPLNPAAAIARKTLDGQLVRMQKALDLADIMLADTGGTVVYVSNPRHKMDLSRSLGEISPEILSQRSTDLYFSDVFINRLAGNRPEILATVPIADLNGAPAGTLILEIDMEPLYRLIQDTTGLGATGEILVGKRSGSDIVYLNPLRHDNKAVLSRHVGIGKKIALPIQNGVAGKTGIGMSVDYRGNNVVAAWTHIAFPDWGLVAKIDAREEFAVVTNLQRLLFMVLAVVFVMAGIITFSVAQSISVPIQKLAKGAEIIGGGNLDHKVGMTLNDEIGRLSRSFDKMTHDLRTTLASRDELNREIERRKAAEGEREIAVEFLQLVNDSKGLEELVRSAVSFLKQKSGFESVGIRLRQGDDYPYFETRGFPEEFVLAETHLCSRDSAGMPVRGSDGYPIMECMCGNVIQGRTDPSKSFFTKRGSFWSNGTTELLTTTTEADRQARTRNRCNGEGYESVGLFALRMSGESLGLLQLNDKKKGMFSHSSLALWERLSDDLSVALSKFLAEKELRKSEEGLKQAQELSHLGNWELDLTNNRLTWSDEIYRIFGLAPQEFGATHEAFLHAVHPDDRAAVDAAYSGSVRENKDSYEIEHRVVRKGSGEVRIVHEKCEHFRDAEGRVVRSVGMVHDITERKLAEEKIILAKEEWERTFNSVPDLIAILDRKHTIMRVNMAMAKKIGRTPDECAGLKCYEVVHGSNAPPFFCPHAVLLTDGKEHAVEVHEDNLGGDFLVTTTPLFGTDGQMTGSVHVARDITERKKAEEALRESQERFRVIADASPIQISVGREEDGTILFTNPEYDRAFGFAKGELLGRKTPELYNDPAERNKLIKALKEAGALKNYEIQVKKSDGTPFWVSISINRIIYSGEPALLATSIDITDRKRAEEDLRMRTEELRETNEELTFFNRTMADREERMIELKMQINELCKQLGKPPHYDVDFGEEKA
jgi:PAS domain S-box-containing protein